MPPLPLSFSFLPGQPVDVRLPAAMSFSGLWPAAVHRFFNFIIHTQLFPAWLPTQLLYCAHCKLKHSHPCGGQQSPPLLRSASSSGCHITTMLVLQLLASPPSPLSPGPFPRTSLTSEARPNCGACGTGGLPAVQFGLCLSSGGVSSVAGRTSVQRRTGNYCTRLIILYSKIIMTNIIIFMFMLHQRYLPGLAAPSPAQLACRASRQACHH